MSQKRDYLDSVDVFKGLSSEDLDSVDHNTRLVRHKAGHLFFMPDDQAEILFILKAGRVQLYRMSPDGRKLIVAILNEGAMFGHMALVGQGLHDTYAQALEPCVVCIWGRDEVERLLRNRPDVALRLLSAVGERLSQVEDRLSEITFKRVPARLASLILRLHDQQGGQGVVEGYTHQYLADMTGIYRETATQTLNAFKSQKLVALGRKRIQVIDEAGLVALAEEG